MQSANTGRWFVFVSILFVAACGVSSQPQADAEQAIKCPELRPEMCTMDYNPVCGNLADGTVKTYSNGCNACSDPSVTSYNLLECQ
jgi:hypothetical protein